MQRRGGHLGICGVVPISLFHKQAIGMRISGHPLCSGESMFRVMAVEIDTRR
jgi:hypothetical protein